MRVGIVGCGINGAYLAWRLSERHDVIVFEKKRKIGKEICSGLVSERLWDFIPKNNKIVQNRIEKMILHFPKKDVTLDLYPPILVLNRKLLDRYVAGLAERNGAKIFLNSEVKKVFFFKNAKPHVLISKEIFGFDYLIGCDGYSSITRKTLGISDPTCRLGIYTYVNKRDISKKTDVYPLKNGFAWRIPRGSKIEYGVIENIDISKMKFLNFCKRKKIKIRKIYSHVIPEGLVEASKKRIALCGDAIGLTKPWSAGGIIWGLTADNILIKNFPNFKKYNEKLKDYFEPKMFFSKIIESLGRFIGNNIPSLALEEIYFDGDWIF